MQKISIIIPLYNSPIIDKTIESIKNQDFDLTKTEIIVVGKDDLNKVKKDKLVRFIKTDVSVSEARNIGIRESKGDLLVFLDSDCVADEKWLKQLVFQHGKGHSVIGGGVAISGGCYMATCYNIATFHEFLNIFSSGNRNYLPTINMSITRKVANEVGFLKERLIGDEINERLLSLTRNLIPKAPYEN